MSTDLGDDIDAAAKTSEFLDSILANPSPFPSKNLKFCEICGANIEERNEWLKSQGKGCTRCVVCADKIILHKPRIQSLKEILYTPEGSPPEE